MGGASRWLPFGEGVRVVGLGIRLVGFRVQSGWAYRVGVRVRVRVRVRAPLLAVAGGAPCVHSKSGAQGKWHRERACSTG